MAIKQPTKFEKKFMTEFKGALTKAINIAIPIEYTMRNRKLALAISSFIPLLGVAVIVVSRYMTGTALHSYFWQSNFAKVVDCRNKLGVNPSIVCTGVGLNCASLFRKRQQSEEKISNIMYVSSP